MRLAFLLTALFTATICHAQVKLEDVIKPGTKLIYSVTDMGTNYELTITAKDIKGKSFDWELGAPKYMVGTLNHTDKALQNGYKIYTFFQSETRTLDDQTLCMWLSQRIYKELAKGANAVKVCMHSPEMEPTQMKQFMDGEFSVKINGNGAKMMDKVVRPAKKVKDKWIIDIANDDSFSYYNSPAMPVILRFHGDFSFALKEIQNNG